MEKSLNEINIDRALNNVKAKPKKKKIENVSKDVSKLDNQLESSFAKKRINVMAKRYELAYNRLHNELPSWKKHSFNKDNKSLNDTLYNEFIASVIALAEDYNELTID